MSTYVFVAGSVQVTVEADSESRAWSELFRRKNAIESVYQMTLPDSSSFRLYSAY